MQQVKIFKGVEAEVSALEEDVNEWIRATGARILNITGNIAPQSGQASGGKARYVPSDVLLIVLYETPSS